MSENTVFYSEADNPAMMEAFEKARASFKYFWRELSWEARRIVPALNLACVKIAFVEETEDADSPLVEYMWINDVAFDGDTVSGTLLNDPEAFHSVQSGDVVQVPFAQVSDWLFYRDDKSYGGFTIQLMRSQMDAAERAEHDEAWDLNFGDFNEVLVVADQLEHPENFIEHPMSLNMKDSFVKFLQEYPQEAASVDEAGYTMLHKEAIAGNRSLVEVLVQAGADPQREAGNGKTPLDFAMQLDWPHLLPALAG